MLRKNPVLEVLLLVMLQQISLLPQDLMKKRVEKVNHFSLTMFSLKLKLNKRKLFRKKQKKSRFLIPRLKIVIHLYLVRLYLINFKKSLRNSE